MRRAWASCAALAAPSVRSLAHQARSAAVAGPNALQEPSHQLGPGLPWVQARRLGAQPLVGANVSSEPVRGAMR